MKKCLICYDDLPKDRDFYHDECIKKSLLKNIDPLVPYNFEELSDLGRQIIQSRFSVTGVQTKISMTTSEDSNPKKFTLIGYKSNYILKPPSTRYPRMPENEDLTMKLAKIAKIPTVSQTLVPMKSGEIAYITERMDRTEFNKKIHMEDMAQISNKLTEHKYLSSAEQVGKKIYTFSENKMFDVITYFDLIIFCLITGNADMHLKNFSLIYTEKGIRLAPAYDLLNTKIITSDEDESALTIDGKKKNITLKNLNRLASALRITDKARDNIYKKYSRLYPTLISWIKKSLLDDDLKNYYAEYLNTMIERFGF
ncbi:MAG: HipA domain-containing protein [Spirochaetes bacterium]|nr:HipA domain-containing protein [Spirochaetota bacterium]MBN2770934.1 HipA domain-containing protein [Spirochaetota bacterium]